eukprot:scaffold11_cov257-Pinguiococcus_pyrenoidosus.AAC.17
MEKNSFTTIAAPGSFEPGPTAGSTGGFFCLFPTNARFCTAERETKTFKQQTPTNTNKSSLSAQIQFVLSYYFIACRPAQRTHPSILGDESQEDRAQHPLHDRHGRLEAQVVHEELVEVEGLGAPVVQPVLLHQDHAVHRLHGHYPGVRTALEAELRVQHRLEQPFHQPHLALLLLRQPPRHVTKVQAPRQVTRQQRQAPLGPARVRLQAAFQPLCYSGLPRLNDLHQRHRARDHGVRQPEPGGRTRSILPMWRTWRKAERLKMRPHVLVAARGLVDCGSTTEYLAFELSAFGFQLSANFQQTFSSEL